MTTTITEQARKVSFLWLELTGRCGLACSHCYSSSGPAGSHGSMTGDDWRSGIRQAAGLGVAVVQFIGGEPTLHPQFAELLADAVSAGLAAEMYSNLPRASAPGPGMHGNPPCTPSGFASQLCVKGGRLKQGRLVPLSASWVQRYAVFEKQETVRNIGA